MNTLQTALSKIEDLRTLPTVYARLCEIMANPKTTVYDVESVLASDQSSASRILRIANSPVYGFSKKVDTISKAIFYIGFTEVKNLVLAMSVIDIFSPKFHHTAFNPLDFWKYSIAVGVANRSIAMLTKASDSDQRFLAGVLHSIGKMFIYEHFPNEFSRIIQICNEEKKSMREAEKIVLGFSHQVLGSLIAEKWKLPESVSNAIKYYHQGVDDRGRIDESLASLHLSCIAAQCLKIGNSGEFIIEKPNSSVYKFLKLSVGDFQKALDIVESESKYAFMAINI